jgi:crotonobetainyl-CoA:carnitine CoA-transferase CaiB-like acyl-CoA transferase
MTDATPRPPLHGLRVLDLSWLLPGPFCTSLFADLGADVVKVERPGDGDYVRDLLPGMFTLANRGKKSVVFDLRSDPDRRRLLELAASADVMVEGFRPGVVARLGVGYEQVRALNPRIVYASISGYGQAGAHAGRPGHDVNYAGTAGLLSVPSSAGSGDPARSAIPVTDIAAGMYAAVSILAALRQREETGAGAWLDVSMTDCALAWSALRWADGPAGPGEGWRHVTPANDSFVTADGVWLAFGLIEPKFWAAFCRLLGDDRNPALSPEVLPTARTAAEQHRLKEMIAAEVARFPADYFLAAAEAGDIPISRVAMTFAELRSDPVFADRDIWTAGLPGRDLPRYPVRMPGLRQPGPAPGHGADGDAVRAGPAWSHADAAAPA